MELAMEQAATAMAALTADESRFRLGENGHAELTADGLGDVMLAFFDKLVRGLDEARIREFVGEVFAEARARGDPQCVKNLFVLAFQTRWCRGGKGERKICYQLLAVLYERYPEVVVELAELLPRYGYWKDLLSLLLECKRADIDYSSLRRKVFSLFARQLKADAEELEAAKRAGRTPTGLSLAAKFAPSEGGQHSRSLKADKEICRLLFPALVGAHIADGEAAWATARAKYRRLLSSVRRALALPEVLMCAQEWSEIDMSHVPSLAMSRYKRAFLNEGKGRSTEDPERAACRENLLTVLTEKGVAALKGKQLFPHELVKEVLEPKGARGRRGALSEGVTAVLNVQWEAVRQGLLEQVEARKAELAQAAAPLQHAQAVGAASQACPGVAALSVAAEALAAEAVSAGASRPVGLSRLVCMADVSGSMSGTPMHVAIALGVLVSEVCHPAFRDKVLTFSEDPRWHQLQPGAAFVDKVQSLQSAHWGGSTDFAKAMRKIAELVSAQRLEQHDVPDLLVVSDMQFDEARGGYGGYGGYGRPAPHAHGWDTAHEEIVALFHQVGMQVHGRPLNPPNIIFWNVRADTFGYPAAADQKGVMLLSGYSPALMKFVLSGEMEEEVATALDDEGNVVTTRRQVDPRETLQRVLGDSGLDAVRAVLDAVPSSKLPAQSWVPQ